MNNFRPVSNLSFISKVVERVVTSQLHQYLAANDLLPRFQSAYRKYHSTETAMQRVWFDILVAADDRQVKLLGLLDLSTAFDCVNHSMLLERLQSAFGLADLVHDWVQCSHFWPTECSRLPTVVNCLLCSRYYLGFRKDPYWARCCTFCSQLSWPSSLTVMDSTCTSMPITRRFTSAHRLVTLRLPSDVSYHCPVWLHLTWPPTVSWSPTKVVVSCALPTQGHVSSEEPAAAMETDALLLQVWRCGTVCQLIWDKLTLTLNSLNGS